MPRPLRSQGRPGTPVIPNDWEDSHATVVRKTFTATVQIFPPFEDQTAPVLAADLTYATSAAVDPIYQGGARIQVLNGQETTNLVGDQAQLTAGYLVVVDRDGTDIPPRAVVRILTSTDPTLNDGRRLTVRKVARGSMRWERDLWCVDDMTKES